MENIGVRQMIFQGPPGTSKTFDSKKFVLEQLNAAAPAITGAFVTQENISRDLADFKLTEADYSNPAASGKLHTGGWDIVQFHPSYGYEDFIRGIEVKAPAGTPVYSSVNRILGKSQSSPVRQQPLLPTPCQNST
jgi:murein DD-endopeptidase MepM/ murein hydrolase activator NlpD